MKKTLKIITFVDFVKRILNVIKDHCHLTGRYRGPAHNTCNINVKQKVFLIPFLLHNFSIYDCHMFFKKLVDKKKEKLNLNLYLKQMKNIFQLNMVVLDL